MYFPYYTPSHTDNQNTSHLKGVYVPSHLRTSSNLQTDRWQMGRSHLAIFCPICRRPTFLTSADGTSHLPTFCPICRRDVSRWDIPSANILPGRHFVQSADGTSHLATLCPICRRDVSRWDIPSANILPNLPLCPHFVQSAYWTKCSQMGHPVC